MLAYSLIIDKDLSTFIFERHAEAISSAYPTGLVGTSSILQPSPEFSRERKSGSMNAVYFRRERNPP